MQKVLNIENATEAMQKKGLTQTAVAEGLAVSKEAVSQWLNAKSFPRPNKLLQLGKLLGLTFDQLVIKQELNTPKVAFRKKGSAKTKSHHVEKAQEMGVFYVILCLTFLLILLKCLLYLSRQIVTMTIYIK